MKKLFIIIVSIITSAWSVSAQNIFFPSKQGMKLVYVNMNEKGKPESFTRQTILSVVGAGDNMVINYLSQVLDKNQNQIGDTPIEIPMTVTVNDGVVELDMRNFGSPGTESFIEIEGDKLRIPPTLTPGDKLEDVNFIITLNMGFKIRTEVSLIDQECLAIEEITVPAGVFECHKVTQTSHAKVMRQTAKTTIITWYAPNVGTVKSETYNEKGKLQSSTELFSIE